MSRSEVGGRWLVDAIAEVKAAGDRQPAMQQELKRLAAAAHAGEITPREMAIGVHRAFTKMMYGVERDPDQYDWQRDHLKARCAPGQGWQRGNRTPTGKVAAAPS